MQDTFKIGLVLKPQGIKGELKVQSLSGDVNRFKNLKEVLIDDKTYRISRTSVSGNTAFVLLSGVNDRNAAETFRGKFLCVKREDAIELKKDEYFIADLIGLKLCTEDGTVGKITDVTNAKTDVITVLTEDGRVLRFPFLKDLLIKVDLGGEIMLVKKKRLAEVSVYED